MCAFMYSLLRSDTSASHILLFLVYTGVLFFSFSMRVRVRHFPSLVPATATGNTGRRACIVCNHTNRREKKNTNTRYQCDVCNVGLCVIGYFGDYDTLKHF